MSKKVSIEKVKKLVKDLGYGKSVQVKHDDLEFEVTPYLSAENKRLLIELVVENCFIEDEKTGLTRHDKIIEKATFGFLFVRDYTNINLSNQDIFETYDMLNYAGIIDKVKDNLVNGEYATLKDMLEIRIEEEYRLQELNSSIGHKLENTLGVLNRKMSEGINSLNSFNPEQLQMLTSFLDDAKKDETNVAHKTEGIKVETDNPNFVQELQEELIKQDIPKV